MALNDITARPPFGSLSGDKQTSRGRCEIDAFDP